MRSVKGTGFWEDGEGGVKPGTLKIDVDEARALIAFALGEGDPGEELPTGDRRIVFFLLRLQQMIRRREYASRPITPDPKPKDRQPNGEQH